MHKQGWKDEAVRDDNAARIGSAESDAVHAELQWRAVDTGQA